VGKEYELKCLLDNKEKEKEGVVIEAVAETVDVVVVEVDSAVVVVDGNVEVAQKAEAEAEVENADVLDGLHPTGQCQKVEVDQLHPHHPGDDDHDQPPARINTH